MWTPPNYIAIIKVAPKKSEDDNYIIVSSMSRSVYLRQMGQLTYLQKGSMFFFMADLTSICSVDFWLQHNPVCVNITCAVPKLSRHPTSGLVGILNEFLLLDVDPMDLFVATVSLLELYLGDHEVRIWIRVINL